MACARLIFKGWLASLIVGLSVNSISADESKTPPPPTPKIKEAAPPQPAPTMEPTKTYQELFPGSGVAGESTIPFGSEKKKHHLLYPCPRCWAENDTIGSGNCKTDCWFLFSSSRSFFNEGCVPPPEGEGRKHHFFNWLHDRR